MSALLQNALLSFPQVPTAVHALWSLPPAVVDEFWNVTAAATRVSGEGSETDHRRAALLFESTLRLICDALRDAAVPDEELEKELDQQRALETLKKLLMDGGYFREIIYLLSRIVRYGQTFLHHDGDTHPVFVMDANMLLNAVERLTGYVPYVAASRGTASILRQPEGDPGDQDFMFLVRAVAGDPSTWFPKTERFSEFNMFKPLQQQPANGHRVAGDGRRREDTVYYLSHVWCGATARERTDLLRRQKEFWKSAPESRTKAPEDIAAFPDIGQDDEQKELWFFINGVATDHWIAQLNAEHLAHLFKRRIHILHNYTLGLDRDLRECVRGRTLEEHTIVARQLLRELKRYAQAKGKVKVVIIAHSQGTIIASEMVKRLADRGQSEADPALLERLEVYHFAFCADEFPEGARHVEHFVNERDFVPSLSVVPKNYYNVPGHVFRRAGAAGHLLSAHYLEDFAHGEYKEDAGAGQSVLFRYLYGKNYGRILT